MKILSKSFILSLLLSFLFFGAVIHRVDAGWTQQTGSGARSWWDVAMSSDGSKIIGLTRVSGSPGSGDLYISNDYGVTWTKANVNPGPACCVAMSSNGSKIAVVNPTTGIIYVSIDGGSTWSSKTNAVTAKVQAGDWDSMGLAYSGDGSLLVASYAANPYDRDSSLFTSSNDGSTWTVRPANAFIYGSTVVAASNNGNILVTGEAISGEHIRTSYDRGVTWQTQSGSDTRYWQKMKISADGQKMLVSAIGNIGRMWLSKNAGVTWSNITILPSTNPLTIALTPDGNKIVAAASDLYLYVSDDEGATWTKQTCLGTHNWISTATSNDGSKIVALDSGGYAYTYSGIGGMPTTCSDPFTFSLSNNGNKSATQGASATSSITSTLVSGTTAPVTLFVKNILNSSNQNVFNVANGISTTSSALSVNPVTPTASSVLTLNSAVTTPVGNYTVEVDGTGGGLTASTTYTLTISAPNYNLTATSTGNSCTDPEGVINLGWNRLTGATSYTLYEQTGGNPERSYTISQPAGGTMVATSSVGLSPGALYSYRVVANTAQGSYASSGTLYQFASRHIQPDGVTACAPSSYTLTVNIVGTGTVTGSAGFTCSTGSCSHLYASGTSIPLTQAAGSGHSFTSWSGACTGSGSCTVVMDGDKSVTATFASTPGGPVSCALSASPSSLPTGGGNVSLNWSSTNATICSISGGAYTNSSLSGSASVPITQTTPFTMSCSAGGPVSQCASQTVTVANASTPTISMFLSNNPTRSYVGIRPGSSARVNWIYNNGSQSDFDSCTKTLDNVTISDASTNAHPAGSPLVISGSLLHTGDNLFRLSCLTNGATPVTINATAPNSTLILRINVGDANIEEI